MTHPATAPDRADDRPGAQPSFRSTGLAAWSVPVALVALGAITAGTLRLVQLAGGPAVIPADDRSAGASAPLMPHIVAAAVYAVVGAFQFSVRLRRRHLAWHRHAGRVLALAGLLVAGSAVWMTLLYDQEPGTGDLLYVLRLVFGSAMAASLVLGVSAVRRHDVVGHRAWMIRAYAIAVAAGTQVLTEGIGGAVLAAGDLNGDLAKGAAWVINLTLAEWVIRRPGHGLGRAFTPAAQRVRSLP